MQTGCSGRPFAMTLCKDPECGEDSPVVGQQGPRRGRRAGASLALATLSGQEARVGSKRQGTGRRYRQRAVVPRRIRSRE